MPQRPPPLYQRGKYWLDWDERADGSRRSPYLAVWWYDPASRRTRSRSTGTADPGEAQIFLDRRYLADTGEAPAFCAGCGRPMPHGRAYLLADAIADYRLEHGDHQASASSIVARLGHVIDFLEAGDAERQRASGDPDDARQLRFGTATNCADAATGIFAECLRGWLRRQPVRWIDGEGATRARPRAPASVEESIVQLAAALNHAVEARRSDARPAFRPIARAKVTRARRVRLEVPAIASMLAYAAEPRKRRGALHGFLVVSICTIARPAHVFDLSVDPARDQWHPGSPTIDLNPAGRVQTDKRRPVLPVLPPLESWLRAERARFDALDPDARIGAGRLVNHHGQPVASVKTAWRAMLQDLGMPREREWMPYVLRHSLATLCRRRGAVKWELEGWLGHRSGTSETYAVGDAFPSVVAALQSILDEMEALAPGTLHRTCTGTRLPSEPEGRRIMGP